jgi:exopolyphosphatase
LDEFVSSDCCQIDPQNALTHRHFVVGNAAGDADTIISAITLAYIESIVEASFTHQPMQEETTHCVTPIVAIPKADLAKRPEVEMLFELAVVVNASENLLFIDDPIFSDKSIRGANVTLVDHNALQSALRHKRWTVVEIVDHHYDEEFYLHTCNGSARNIAFAKGEALVASACTLVAERLKQAFHTELTPDALYPASLSILLLGVILLDSCNLSPEAGKVTSRDVHAVRDLIDHTDWSTLSDRARQILDLDSNMDTPPDRTKLFDVLQECKYSSVFWNSLSVSEALHYDYKDFFGNNGVTTFGISTVLESAQSFLRKHNTMEGITDFMDEVSVNFLAIMFAHDVQDGIIRRQLGLCAKGDARNFLDDLVGFLLREEYPGEPLHLQEIQWNDNLDHFFDDTSASGLSLRFFDQINIAPSRKQIGPLLSRFFDHNEMHSTAVRLS